MIEGIYNMGSAIKGHRFRQRGSIAYRRSDGCDTTRGNRARHGSVGGTKTRDAMAADCLNG